MLGEEEKRFGECPKCKKQKWLHFYMGMRGEKLVSGWVCLDCLNEMRSGKNNGEAKGKSKTGL